MKERLITALKSERERVRNKTSLKSYDEAIKYLETGELPTNFGDYYLLNEIVIDFEYVCSTYGITK